MKLSRSLLVAMAMFCIMHSAVQGQGGADLVLLDGKVWTGDPARPETEAIAIRGDRVLATGTSEAMRKLALPEAKTIELHGRRVLPAFNDSHVHIQMGGANLVGVHLTDTRTPAEFRQRIGDYAKTIREMRAQIDAGRRRE